MTTVPHPTVRWRKSKRSTAEDTCVELACDNNGYANMVRDSKNPAGPTLRAPMPGLLAAAKAGQLG